MFLAERVTYSIFSNLYFKFGVPREFCRFYSIKTKTHKKMSESNIQKVIKSNKATTTASKKSRFPPGEMYLSVLGNGSSSSARSLYMFTDHERYIFNCGEGTQRLANEHKMRLSKLDNIFITHHSWENIGGLLGLSLTIQDMGVEEVTIHSPPGILSLYEFSQSFVNLPSLEIKTKTYSDVSYKDNCMEVSYIPVFKSSAKLSTLTNSEDLDHEHKSKKLRLDANECSRDMTMAFACKGHSKPGRMLLEKCVEFGVPVGPLLGDLKNGKDITLPCGKVVRSKDVVSEEEVCPLFLVVECPSEDFLDPFVSEKRFCPYQEDVSQLASLVVHFTPSHILNSPKYQKWMQQFPSTTCHLILNSDCASLNSLAVHRIQHQLNLLHPGIFSLLQEDKVLQPLQGNNIVYARTLERYYLRPAKELDRSFAIKLEPKSFIEEAQKIKDFNSQLKTLQSSISEIPNQHNNEIYPEITFLGTGSSIPSKARNVSAILVNSSKDNCFLMDCGEGTYGQLLRLCRHQYKEKLLQLFCIFISHMHADHHLGLVKLLKERQKLIQDSQVEYEPVYLVGPRELDLWLKNYYTHFEEISPLYRFVECRDLELNPFGEFASVAEQDKYLKEITISTVPVIHCKDSHGAIISSKSKKWKLVYSGDTIPCKRLIEAGKNCSLLIHEATMEDELSAEAAAKRHSTTSEAIKVAEDMNAGYTILTHFSQRYAKVPLFNENFHNHVGCAFDNMTVRPDQFYILPLLLPTLKTLFAEYIEDMNIKGYKRRNRETMKNNMIAETVNKKLCTGQR